MRFFSFLSSGSNAGHGLPRGSSLGACLSVPSNGSSIEKAGIGVQSLNARPVFCVDVVGEIMNVQASCKFCWGLAITSLVLTLLEGSSERTSAFFASRIIRTDVVLIQSCGQRCPDECFDSPWKFVGTKKRLLWRVSSPGSPEEPQ